MKKFLFSLLTLLFTMSLALVAFAEPLFLTATVAAPGEEDLTQEEALVIAKKEWEKTLGAVDYERKVDDWLVKFPVSIFVNVTVDGKTERAWCMALRDRITEDGCVVTILSPSGTVVDVATYKCNDVREEVIKTKGDLDFLSLEDMMIYGAMVESLPGDTARRGLPEEGDLTREEAIAKAKEIVLERSDVSAEDLDAMPYVIAYWVNVPIADSEKGNYDTNHWTVAFGTGGPDVGEPFHSIYYVNLSVKNGDVFFYYDEVKQGPANG